MKRAAVVCVVLTFLAGACGPGKPQASPPVASPSPGAWATWSHEQKRAYMQSTVIKTERELFSTFDSARYGDFDCKSCHGAGAADGSFKMPNPDLPKWPGGAAAFKELAARDPKMLAFMQKTVVPETARLLGVKSFDFASHTGFSCFQCHVKGQPDGAPPGQ